ncbi:hypothetical protein Prudu_021872 [Prunus dulcis]|uniref:Uncharacterized protein n=1 Tax=Prunus dulcis TaxID=3755 RepID=A0A4Y1RYF4_PRUDU|nr:hypothetical protein Prudu_021872 [Prunus dulcis]
MPIKGHSSFTFQNTTIRFLYSHTFTYSILSILFWATVLWLGVFYPTVNVLIADLKPAYWGRILESCRPSLPARREATKALGQHFVASLLFIGIEMDSVETNNVKPGKFNGTNFKRWQRQLKYWLTVLGLVSALEDQTTPDKTTETTSKTKEKMTKEELEYHCHNRILSALSDDLYDVYQDTKNAKTLWDELEAEYGIEDAGIDRFTISNFNNYMMVENKTVSEQIHEYQDFLRKIELKGTKFSEEFKVSCLIDKLPPSWLNFAKTLGTNKEF